MIAASLYPKGIALSVLISALLALTAGAFLAIRSPPPTTQRVGNAQVKVPANLVPAEPAVKAEPVVTLAHETRSAAQGTVEPMAQTLSASPERHSDLGAERDARRAEQIDVQFEADPGPVPESRRMRATLAEVFGGFAERGVNVDNIECHYRLCRVNLLFNSVSADIDVLGDIFVRRKSPEINQMGQAIAPMREYLSTGQVKTTLYIAREGLIEIFE